MEAILSAGNLDLYYGQTQALKGVSIDIPAREVTALIGPSGCGKSTFLKTLDRMNDLVPGVTITGSVQYRGKEIYDPDVDVTWLRKQIGMVFQKPNPFPMSIYDNIAYGPRTHGIRNKAKLDEIVERSLRGAAIWDEVTYVYAKEQGEFEVAFAIAAILMILTLIINLAANFVGKKLKQRQG